MTSLSKSMHACPVSSPMTTLPPLCSCSRIAGPTWTVCQKTQGRLDSGVRS